MDDLLTNELEALACVYTEEEFKVIGNRSVEFHLRPPVEPVHLVAHLKMDLLADYPESAPVVTIMEREPSLAT
ncbi:MAG: hypothetical protein KVP17_000062 [Porospora cf. gigantea B]|uniref:uncharacterized protein n=1 Tax=Porospora cf. gigantea B TaxID=2853592 RepID=UPI0035717E17|nr:MAG: hypothetical protein KVP17_000062 [Porospora cf. gigantea B]